MMVQEVAAPADAPRVAPKPRKVNRFRAEDGKVLVSLVSAVGDLKDSVRQSVDLLGGLGRLVRPGDDILLKPNFNSDDPPPASTDVAFLRAVVELLQEAGAGQVTIGETCGRPWWPPRSVMERKGIFRLAEETGARVVPFEEDEWVEVELNGRYVQSALMPRTAYEADKVIYLPCLKTHRLTRFTLSLKVAFGFTHITQRTWFHEANLEEKVADLSLAWQPDLIILDGRRAFVSGGPAKGDAVEPGVILASADQVALDVEAIRILQSYPADNLLTIGPWEMPQIQAAISHRLGVSGPEQYVLRKG